MERTETSSAANGAAAKAAQARAAIAAGLDHHLADLRRFNLTKRLAELAVFVALWAAGGTLTLTWGMAEDSSVFAWACYLIGIFISAVAINAFVLLLHEGMHHTLFTSPFANRWVSVLLGAPVLMSFTAYQVMHLRHHAYLGDPRDPDDYQNHTNNKVILWVMHCLRLLVGAFLYLLLIPLLAWRHGSPISRRRLVHEYLLLALLCTLVALTVPGWVLIHGWFLPAVLVGYMTNIRGFTQHGITDAHDPFLASRSVRPHPAVAFCLLYENYHLEHHFFPEIPSYHLPRLHRLIWPRLPRAVTARSYLGFLARFARASLTLDASPIGLTSPSAIATQNGGEERGVSKDNVVARA
jgi:fatty acid desaturase